jgi:hypothetical protein
VSKISRPRAIGAKGDQLPSRCIRLHDQQIVYGDEPTNRPNQTLEQRVERIQGQQVVVDPRELLIRARDLVV